MTRRIESMQAAHLEAVAQHASHPFFQKGAEACLAGENEFSYPIGLSDVDRKAWLAGWFEQSLHVRITRNPGGGASLTISRKVWIKEGSARP